MANNQALAQIRGVNTTYLQYLTWAVASALAALAGTLIALTARIYPELGWDQVLVISAAAIIGGLGSIYGVMLAAVLVGLTSSLATLAIPRSTPRWWSLPPSPWSSSSGPRDFSPVRKERVA